MIVKTETTRTYWVGMTEDQRKALISFVRNFSESDIKGITRGFEQEGLDAISDLRESLLNV